MFNSLKETIKKEIKKRYPNCDLVLKVCNATDHYAFETDLRTAIKKSEHLDIVVAFITRYGIDLLTDMLKNYRLRSWTLTTSVLWPTNLDQLAKLSRSYPSKIYIHLAGATPEEKKGHHYQLHTKMIRSRNKFGSIDLFVGSHNWTLMALKGFNLENSMLVTCEQEHSLAISSASHIAACQRQSEKFDYNRIDFYKYVQDFYKQGASFSRFPGFNKDNRIIMMAEAEDEMVMKMNEFQLFFSPHSDFAEKEGKFGRKVDLYLYPKGTLLEKKKPSVDPWRYEGEIAMMNDLKSGAVEARRVNSCIEDLQVPILKQATEIPHGKSDGLQVVVQLRKTDENKLPIFHAGNKPKTLHTLNYNNIPFTNLSSLAGATNLNRYLSQSSWENEEIVKKHPKEMLDHVEIDFIGEDFYRQNPINALRAQFSPLQDEEPQKDIKVEQKKDRRNKETWETPYFYRVNYRFEI